ncbi:hypothetical protein ABH920_006396 [Catenulispora sp. EB89]|uniref:hypothetical protein n=1 Tax=Catenulispora sp. EB89 TaxID=3156257 RepID=UPI003516AC0F
MPDDAGAAAAADRRMADAVAASCARNGADLNDDAAHAGFTAALVTLTGMFKGYLANELVDQDSYDLVVATVAALVQAGDVIRQD